MSTSDERAQEHNPTKRLVGSIRRSSESRRHDASGLARRSRQEATAAEGGEEADGTPTSKPPTEGERLDTGNALIQTVATSEATIVSELAATRLQSIVHRAAEVVIMEAFQQRVLDEKSELDERRAKLHDFIQGLSLPEVFPALPLNEQRLMHQQLAAMNWYSETLTRRLEAWGVLPKA